MNTNIDSYSGYRGGSLQPHIQPSNPQSNIYYPSACSVLPQQQETRTHFQPVSHYILSYTQYGMFPNPLMPPPHVSTYPLYDDQSRITFSPETPQTTRISEQTAYILPKDLPSSVNVKVHFYGGSGKPEILDHSVGVTVSDSQSYSPGSCSRPHTPMPSFSSTEFPKMGSNFTVKFGESALTGHATQEQLPQTLRFVSLPVKEECEQDLFEEPEWDEDPLDYEQNESRILKSPQSRSDNELSTYELEDNTIKLVDWHHVFHGHITTLRHMLANIPVSETLAIPSNCKFIEKLFVDIQKIGNFITRISGENGLSNEDIILEEKFTNEILLLGKANQGLIIFAQLQTDRCQELIDAKLAEEEIRIALDKIKLIHSIIDSTNNVLEFLKTKLY